MEARVAVIVCLLLLPGQAKGRSVRSSVAPNVVVLHRSGLGAYEAVAQQFRAGLRVPVHVLALSDQAGSALLTKVRDLRPELIFAIGQAAYDLARDARLRPLAYAYVYKNRAPVDYGVHTQVSPILVIEALRDLHPTLKRFAVVSGPHTRWVARQATRAARREQIEVDQLAATSPAHALSLLRQLPRAIEAVWLLADLDSFSEQVVRFAIALQFRRRVPLVAPTQLHVRRGALLALDYPPAAIALRATKAANRLLRRGGRSARLRELARWRRRSDRLGRGVPRLSINPLTAERIDIPLHRIIDRAEVVR